MGPLEPLARRPRGRALWAACLTFGFGLWLLLANASSDASAASPADESLDAVAASNRKEASNTAAAEEGQDACTVILLRHAEKDPSGDAKDPGLGEAGRKRAAALAGLLAHAGVTRLYASEFKRAQETLAPLAERSGLKVEIVPAGDPARLIAALSSGSPGSVSVVAGHSNTIPALLEKLGGQAGDLLSTPQGPQLRETEFDRMFVLTLGPPLKSGEHASRLAVSTLELRYGD
jgi:phosphohistidine phosphatase SixA